MPDPTPTALERRIPSAVFIVVPLLLTLWGIRNGGFLFGHDVISVFYGLYGGVGDALRSGRWPVWDPTVMCGTPTLAAVQGAVLYPFTWLTAFLSPGAFWTAAAAIHLSLAGFFANAWLRRGLGAGPWGALAGAVVFMLSGFIVTRVYAGHVTFVFAYPWAAALMWRLERRLAEPSFRNAAALAVVTALMILAGFPQAVLIAGLAAAARLLHFALEEKAERPKRIRAALTAAAAMAAGLPLAAPQLLPTLELVSESQRSALKSYDFMTSYSLPPEGLLTFLVPAFFGDSRSVPYWGVGHLWEACGFVGVAALALAAVGAAGRHRQRFLWTATAAAAALIALGQYTPVYNVFYHLVPGASLFRAPGRYLLLFTLACVPLVALGFDRLWNRDPDARRAAGWIASIAGAFALAAAGAWIDLDSPSGGESARWKRVVSGELARAKAAPPHSAPADDEQLRAASHGMSTSSLGWAALALAGVAGGLLAFRAGVAGSAAGLGALLALELLAFNARFFTGHPTRDMTWPDEFVSALKRHPRYPFRVATAGAALIDTVGKSQLSGLEQVGGYDPLMARTFAELVNAGCGQPLDQARVSAAILRPSPLFDLMGARIWIVPGPPQPPPGWATIGQFKPFVLYENPNALPRAWLVARSVVLPSREERLAFMTEPAFDARRLVVLESGTAAAEAADVKGTLGVSAMSPGHYAFRVDLPADATLVLAESYFPGWSVRVDGAPAELLRANHHFQAVRLGAGRHDVTFTYRSRFLGLGFAIAALTALLPAAVLFARKRASKRQAPSAT